MSVETGRGEPSFESLLADAAWCARDMWLNGWAENGAGNLSVRMDPGLLKGVDDLRAQSDWLDTGWEAVELGSAVFLTSAKGSIFRRLHDRLSQGCGVILLDRDGARYKTVWGFEPEGSPTSEISAHMAVHAAGAARGLSAVIHAHAPNVIALTCSVAKDTLSLTRLLWSLHSECIVLFPEGIEVGPWSLPGSKGLSEATAQAFTRRRLMVWPFHGVIAAGGSLDEAIGLIEAVEKVSGIFLKAAGAGAPVSMLAEDDLRAIAASFGVTPDEEILTLMNS